MREFQNRKRTSLKVWKYRLISLGLLVLLVLLGRGVWDLVKKNRVAREHYRNAEGELVELEVERDRLLGTLATLKTERGIEAEIRKNFSVAKAGEQLITIVDTGTASSTSDDQSRKRWWQRWFDWF